MKKYVLLLFLVNFVLSGKATAEDTANDYVASGDAKTAANDMDGALLDFNHAVALDPKLATAYNGRGNAKYAEGDLDGALIDFDHAIALDPKLAIAYVYRGVEKYAKTDMDGALVDFNHAILLDPKLAKAYNDRGSAEYARGDHEAGIADFSRAIKLDPELLDAYNNRGAARWVAHDLDGAIADLGKAIDLNPKEADVAYHNRGVVKQARGDLAGAVADFNRAKQLNPQWGRIESPAKPAIDYDDASPKQLEEWANEGDSRAQTCLAPLYFDGKKGLAQDKIIGYKWAVVAASSKSIESTALPGDFEFSMSADEIKQGKALADEFLKKQNSYGQFVSFKKQSQ
jgi:tetratricopeptide (TPR) repeat protein